MLKGGLEGAFEHAVDGVEDFVAEALWFAWGIDLGADMVRCVEEKLRHGRLRVKEARPRGGLGFGWHGKE